MNGGEAMRGIALVTGAEGYVGRCTARALLERSALRLVLAVRSPERIEPLRAWVCSLAADPERVTLRVADLERAEPFIAGALRGVNYVVHCAAVTRFNVERELARKVNVDGTRKLLAFAAGLPELRRVLLVSSVYASGLRSGEIPERQLDARAGFANHYEWSKWSAEALAADEFAHLPIAVARLSTVLADDPSGRIVQLNAFHNTLRLYHAGLLSLVPGRPDTPVHLVTGELVRAALLRLLSEHVAPGFYHVTHAAAHTPDLASVLAWAFEAFEQDPSYRRRGLRRPLFAPAASFEQLADGSQRMVGPVMRQAFSSLTPFARQLYVAKTFENRRLRLALPEYRPPQLETQVRNTVAELLATRWLRAS
jgi:nucleoside-diphosphate-sugar epimerase